MHALEYPPLSVVPVMNAAAQPISGVNQKTYARLKTSLRLNLRRQIFLAVCDDLELRSQLVSRLQAELAPSFVSLNLNLADPNPMAQVTQWLNQQYRQMATVVARGFQILGIEHLMRQPAPVQKRFLTHLQAIEYYMPALECTMLLWVPRPWLRSIQQSAPTFWEWHTALFEFEGDPTPLRGAARPPLLGQPAVTPKPPRETTPPTIIRLPVSRIESWAELESGPEEDGEELENTALIQQSDVLPDALWDILTQDLARLDGSVGADQAAIAPSPSVPMPSSPATDHALAQPSPLHQLLLDALEQQPDSEQHQAGWESLQRIEHLQHQQVAAETVATAYYSLGRAYRECIEQGDSSDYTLHIAIAAHEQTLALLSDKATMGADVANDLGNLYWMRSRNTTVAEHQLASLEQAIQAYHLALAKTNQQAEPTTCAMIQNNLGSAYSDLAQYRDPAPNLQNAVQAYEDSLRSRSVETDPARYAATQNNLGTACWNLAQYQQPMVWLKRAIAAYEAALQYYKPDTEALSYAMIQNNLGTAYWNLAQQLQASKQGVAPASAPEMLLRSAIAAYQNALTYRTLHAAPSAYAATQNNLGTAHWDLAMLASTPLADRRNQYQLAITAYEAAIAAVDHLTQQQTQRPALTFDICATHNNLGLAYYHLAMDRPQGLTPGDRQTALETALSHHLQALQGWDNKADLQQSTLDFVVQTVRALFKEFGIQGQNSALSRIPPAFLAQVMNKL